MVSGSARERPLHCSLSHVHSLRKTTDALFHINVTNFRKISKHQASSRPVTGVYEGALVDLSHVLIDVVGDLQMLRNRYQNLFICQLLQLLHPNLEIRPPHHQAHHLLHNSL